MILWCFQNNRRLKSPIREAITDCDNHVFVSAASSWELAIKSSLGKIKIPNDFEAQCERCEFRTLPISVSQTLSVQALPNHHRDPFDRLLVAQAQTESLTLVTHDPQIWKYDVPVLKV